MRKKQRIIGTETYYKKSTGELVPMDIVESREADTDVNFHKLFLKNFIHALKDVADRKTALCFWILSNLTKENLLLFTYRQIADKTGCSYKTVADTMQVLLNNDFLRRLGSGRYMVNPDIIFKGSYQRRAAALKKYFQAPLTNSPGNPEAKLRTVQNNIERLKKQEQSLQNQIALAKLAEEKGAGEGEEA